MVGHDDHNYTRVVGKAELHLGMGELVVLGTWVGLLPVGDAAAPPTGLSVVSAC